MYQFNTIKLPRANGIKLFYYVVVVVVVVA